MFSNKQIINNKYSNKKMVIKYLSLLNNNNLNHKLLFRNKNN